VRGSKRTESDAVAHHRLVGVVLVGLGALGVVVGGALVFGADGGAVDERGMVVTGLVLCAAGGWQWQSAGASDR